MKNWPQSKYLGKNLEVYIVEAGWKIQNNQQMGVVMFCVIIMLRRNMGMCVGESGAIMSSCN